MMTKLAPTFRRLIERARGAALLGAVAAAAISGYAFAISPTVETGREFTSAVAVVREAIAGNFPAMTVPAGQQYTLTDLIVSTNAGVSGTIAVAVGNGGCNPSASRTHAIFVPTQQTLHLAFLTGVTIGAGKTVCINNNATMSWTIRGYLSNET